MEAVREPLYSITWRGKDVSRDLAPYLLSVEYTDNLHGKKDEIVVAFEDRNGRWKDAWYPQKGDTIKLKIGVNDSKPQWLNAGTFKVDEIDFSGPPDTISVKGLSTDDLAESQSQKKNRCWEKTSLAQIVSDLASKNGLTLVAHITPDIPFDRRDQKDKSDLAFLKELADQYCYITKVDSGRLIFEKEENLEQAAAVATVTTKDQLISYRITTKTHQTYKACEIKYWDPKTKKTIVHRHVEINCPSGDELKLDDRVENQQQAVERAKAELRRKNRLGTSGDLTLIGNTLLAAGANVTLQGFGILSGKYLIDEAQHVINKGTGYVVNCKVRLSGDQSTDESGDSNAEVS